MKNKYTIRYLSSFDEESYKIVYYITYILKNKKAAQDLVENIEKAIIKRSNNPESFEVYKRTNNYNWYRIYVNNYTIFYTVKNNIMEICHIIYSGRNFDILI